VATGSLEVEGKSELRRSEEMIKNSKEKERRISLKVG